MSPGKLRRRLGLKSQNVEYERRVIEAHSALWYNAFARHPVLTEFVTNILGRDDTTLLERTLFRLNVPNGEATYVHYD